MVEDDHPERLTLADYRTLAAFRYEIRRYLAFSQDAAQAANIAPQQYQALLAVKGGEQPVTVGALAAQLFVRTHTAVELVDRMQKAGLVQRVGSAEDRRRVVLELTPEAESRLAALAGTHLGELRNEARVLIELLSRLQPQPGPGSST